MKAVYVCPFVVESLGKCSSRAARPPRIDPDQGMGAPAPLAHHSVAGHPWNNVSGSGSSPGSALSQVCL